MSADSLLNPRNSAVLSVWRPNDELIRFLVEGKAFQIFSVVPAKVHSNEMRLNTTGSTKFFPLDLPNMTKFDVTRRRYYSFFTILEDNFGPPFSEFDTAGLIVYISPFVQSTGQTVYLADADKNILGIKFWAPASVSCNL